MSTIAPTLKSVYPTALAAYRAGISIVPIPPNGRKCPAIEWKEYQQRRATIPELLRWFVHSSNGLACITGAVSGNLECLDFDTRHIYDQWSAEMYTQGFKWLYQRLTTGYVEATPNGIHLLYRCAHPIIEGNQKLACGPDKKALIETRGEGGLVVIAPSCGGVHPSGKPYVVQQGSIRTLPTISPMDRQTLFRVARRFHIPPPTPPIHLTRTPAPSSPTRRPGDIYNERVSWQDVLESHSWTYLFSLGQEAHWQRPGKKGIGDSATTNHGGHDKLYVFTTSTQFEANRGYTKFTVYAILNHNGDFSAAAKSLAEQGYTDDK